MSWIISEAWPSTPIPAVTFKKSTSPEEIELRRAAVPFEHDVSARDHCLRLDRRNVAGRLPVFRGIRTISEPSEHPDEIEDAQHDHRLRNAGARRVREVFHEQDGERRTDHRAAAKAHDRRARRHARPVRKPFDQRRDRRDVTDAETDPADHAVAEIDEPQQMRVDADAGREKPPLKQSAATNMALRGPARFHPLTAERRGKPEEQDGQAEDPAELGNRPIDAGLGCGDADALVPSAW